MKQGGINQEPQILIWSLSSRKWWGTMQEPQILIWSISSRKWWGGGPCRNPDTQMVTIWSKVVTLDGRNSEVISTSKSNLHAHVESSSNVRRLRDIFRRRFHVQMTSLCLLGLYLISYFQCIILIH